MKKMLILGVFVAVLSLSTTSIMADPFGDGGADLQDVLNGFTQGGTSSVNVLTDYMPDEQDSYWSITAVGGSVNTFVLELSDDWTGTNAFGVYDAANPDNMVEIFAGDNTIGDQVTLSIKADGSVFLNGDDTSVKFAGNLFGYYLDSSEEDYGGLFFSNTALNDDGEDHMVAYQGTSTDEISVGGNAYGLWTDNEFLLCFEDVYDNHDNSGYPNYNYTDLVVMVESVNPVPVPAAAFLALLGMSVAGIKLRKFA